MSEIILKARMNAGRWIADCPHVYCKGAELARPGERFICFSEHPEGLRFPRAEAEARYESYAVVFPENKTEIEAALQRRPTETWRNWEWGMTVQELIEGEALLHFSWTTPRTWTTGEVVTASILNTHVRDNFNQTAPAVVTTAGDVLYATGANALTRLAASGNGNLFLRLNSGATALEYAAPGGVLKSQVFG